MSDTLYSNYHKHDHVSNIFVPDTYVMIEDYAKRAVELGHKTLWTTNHGTGGDIFEAKQIAEKYGLKCMFGVEGYIVPDVSEKDKSNYHIIIIPKTNKARKKVNLITSHASETGFYYKPRIKVDDLLALDPDDVYITNACVAGLLSCETAITNIFIPLVEHFGKNFLLEVQNHNCDIQKQVNKLALYYAKKYGLKLVAANDSHYIYSPEGAKDRLEFLKGKSINYGEEDVFILDYPDYDTFLSRFIQQGILTKSQAEDAIKNTLIFEQCEEINIDKSIKMPSIYQNLSASEKIVELKKHVNTKFKQVAKDDEIPKEKLVEYKQGVVDEVKVIEDTSEINTADYFLFNEKLVDLAVNKYGGVLTRTGRGSCGGFYTNRVLGITQLDRFNTGIKLYPERFMSTARLLENRSMPDVDFNVKNQEPFVQAAKELLGEHGCYPMIAYGTMQLGEAFRNVCRSHDLPFDDFNEVGKDIENHLDDLKWKPYIDEAQKYVGVIVSASVHPCAFAMDNKDLREEYGIVRIGDALCCMITSGEADAWKILKDDFLIVVVWKLISETFKLIGKPIISVKELMSSLDEKCWKLLADGITCTLNQVDSDWATELMKKYKAHTVEEGSMFVAALRPSFDSWRDMFINREPYSTGSKQLDEVLKSTGGMILFQENLMQYFDWLGITPAESIGLIKKISKKKIHPEDFQKLEERLKAKWVENTGSIDHFDETWKMIQSCMAYGFCSAHALATFTDCLYGCYLKANYPLQYYQVALTEYSGDMERTKRLTKELEYFHIELKDIKFGRSKANYNADLENRVIYKGVSALKFLNTTVADELYELSQKKQYKTFDELLPDMLQLTNINSRQLYILIALGYFSDFGGAGKLLSIVDIYNTYSGKKLLKKETCTIPRETVLQFATETEKQYRVTDSAALVSYLCENAKPKEFTLSERLASELEYLGYLSFKSTDARDKYNGYVCSADTKFSPKITVYNLYTGKTETIKCYKKTFAEQPLAKGMIITYYTESKPRSRLNPETKQWEKIPNEFEQWFKWYQIKELPPKETK